MRLGRGSLSFLGFALIGLLHGSVSIYASQPIPARQVIVNGQKYRVFYHWTNVVHADEMLKAGGYDEKFHQSGVSYRESQLKRGLRANNYNSNAGLNIASDPVSSAEFAGRNAAGNAGYRVGKLLEVLVPENQLVKVNFNDMDQWSPGESTGWYDVKEPLKGSKFQEFTGVGMSEVEIKELVEKVSKDPGVQRSFKVENASYRASGMKELSEPPATTYLKKRLPQIANKVAPKSLPMSPIKVEKIGVRTVQTKSLKIVEKRNISGVSCMETGAFTSTETTLALKNTLGAASSVLNATGLILAIINVEDNPFSGDTIGVSCEDAYKMKDRAVCEWESKLDPWNNRAHCTIARQIIPLNKKAYSGWSFRETEVCAVEGSFATFEVNDSHSRDLLNDSGLMNSSGIPAAGLTRETMREFLQNLSAKRKIKIEDGAVGESFWTPADYGKDVI